MVLMLSSSIASLLDVDDAQFLVSVKIGRPWTGGGGGPRRPPTCRRAYHSHSRLAAAGLGDRRGWICQMCVCTMSFFSNRRLAGQSRSSPRGSGRVWEAWKAVYQWLTRQ